MTSNSTQVRVGAGTTGYDALGYHFYSASVTWLASASVVLTGEAPASGAVTPGHPFAPATHGGGALELAARVTSLEVGLDAFRAGLADPTRAARRARAWAVGLTWYLNRNVKQVVDFERTTFTGGAAGGDRAPENAVLIRSQISF